jgi:hypothetical protein
MPQPVKTHSSPMQSKKFIAAMTWNISWLALIGAGISQNVDASVLNSMVYASGLVQMLYLGGQSAVDAFVRGAFAKSEQKSEN